MKHINDSRFAIVAAFLVAIFSSLATFAYADENDQWWDDAWPHRVPVIIKGSGVGQVSINFTQVFGDLGLNGGLPTISNYQVERAHDRQGNYGEEVWWYFLYGDRPPLPKPTIMDRPGLEARIIPWLAWLERVDGLCYYSTTDWDPSPWTDPWINNGNGDGFMFYSPKDATIAFDPCIPESNRLVPSIRWELLREGMEDYEYLWLLNRGYPKIDENNRADALAREFIASRTRFSRVPADLYDTRAAIAAEIVSAPNGTGGRSLPWLLL